MDVRTAGEYVLKFDMKSLAEDLITLDSPYFHVGQCPPSGFKNSENICIPIQRSMQ